jgi:two-component response regulator yesN
MYKLLILDDEILFRQYAKAVLDWEKLGFEVYEAGNGEIGLKILEEQGVDLVLADINMPVMDGIEFGKRAREIKEDISIVIVSGYGEFEFAKKAIQIGVSDYILKPFTEDEIRNVVLKIKKELYNKRGEVQGEGFGKQRVLAEKVKNYVGENYKRSNLTVGEIAKYCCVDTSYIRRAFKKTFNMSISEYILTLRMEKAGELIKRNKLKLTSICNQVGFEDYNYFSRAFKRYHKISPKNYEINIENIQSHR